MLDANSKNRTRLIILIILLTFSITLLLLVKEYGIWLQLLNGATWPDYFKNYQIDLIGDTTRSLIFVIIVYSRTIFSLGVSFTGILGIYGSTSKKRREWLMNKINSSLFGNHDIALASFIDSQMRKMHLDLSPAQREGLFEAAKQFHNSRAGQEMCNAIINDTGTSNK